MSLILLVQQFTDGTGDVAEDAHEVVLFKLQEGLVEDARVRLIVNQVDDV